MPKNLSFKKATPSDLGTLSPGIKKVLKNI